jgi:hypothetical protein
MPQLEIGELYTFAIDVFDDTTVNLYTFTDPKTWHKFIVDISKPCLFLGLDKHNRLELLVADTNQNSRVISLDPYENVVKLAKEM